MSKRKYKEFSVLPVGKNFILKDVNGVDTVFITMVGDSDVDNTFTYARAISLRGEKADGEAGLNRRQIAEALRLTDDKEFEGWWQNEISSRTTGPNDRFRVTSAGNVDVYHDGTFTNLGGWSALTAQLSPDFYEKESQGYAGTLMNKLGIEPAEAVEMVTALRQFVKQYDQENNNQDFNVLALSSEKVRFSQPSENKVQTLEEHLMATARQARAEPNAEAVKQPQGAAPEDKYGLPHWALLPSGTRILPELLFVKGKVFKHHTNEGHYVVEQLGKTRVEGDWVAAVFYRPVAQPAKIYSQPVGQFISKMTAVLQTYEIWVEGYRATGDDWKAEKLGEAQGYCFAEACNAYFHRLGLKHSLDLNDPGHPQIIGRGGLYSNEKEARAFNG